MKIEIDISTNEKFASLKGAIKISIIEGFGAILSSYESFKHFETEYVLSNKVTEQISELQREYPFVPVERFRQIALEMAHVEAGLLIQKALKFSSGESFANQLDTVAQPPRKSFVSSSGALSG